jgi:hypothetical protein
MLILWGGNFAVGVGWVVLISGKFCPVWEDFSLTGCLVKHRVAAGRYDEKKGKAVAQNGNRHSAVRVRPETVNGEADVKPSRAFRMFCDS